MAKYLILDKSIFQGTPTTALCRFVETYNVILPDVLFYECVTTSKQKDVILDRCRQAILAGGLSCPSIRTVLHIEARYLRPYGSLIAPEHDDAVRDTFRVNAEPYDVRIIEERQAEEEKFFQCERRRVDEFAKRGYLLLSSTPYTLWGAFLQSRTCLTIAWYGTGFT